MEEIIKIIIEYVSIWAPSLVAVVATVSAVLLTLGKAKELYNKLKEDTDFKKLKEKLENVSKENLELVRCNKLLLEEITKIKNYADYKKKENERD